MATIDYFDDVATTVATLTDLFQFEPTMEVIWPAPSDRFAGTKYDWDGFTVYWNGFENEPGTGIGDPPHNPAVRVVAQVSTVRGITIESQDGVRVGDSMLDLLARYPDSAQTHETEDGSISSVQIGSIPLPPLETAPDLEVYFSVAVVGSTEGTADSILAPAQGNFGL